MRVYVALSAFLLAVSPALVAAETPSMGSSVLIVAERKARDDLYTMLSAGLPVIHESSFSLFIEGDESHLSWLRERGFAARVLDRSAWAWDYFAVGTRPDTDLGQLAAAGDELFREENWRLIRGPRGQIPEAIRGALVFWTRLPHEPLALPVSTPLPRAPGAGTDETGPDPLIQQMVAAVRPAEIDRYWGDLTSNLPTGTRFTISQGCRDAAHYSHDELEAVGVPAQLQSYSSLHAPNVIGTRLGAITPEQVYIVIGHLDDMPWSGLAPGADDNASGTVTVLEAARAMSCFAFRSTVKYIACTGEELGLHGSDAYAADAKARGEDIRGVLNFDMNGWEGDGLPNPENLDLNYNDASEDLALLFTQCAADYDTGLAVNAFLCPSLTASDHYSFWRRGYKALCGITDNEGYCGRGGHYPYYHSRNDTIANCGQRSFFYSTIKATVATLATLAEPFKITFAEPTLTCDTTTTVLVGDRDLNLDPAIVETV
ncbi:MAG: Zn-dependent exopeptidase M28, partial [Acidobacteriota bacterium]